MNKFLIAAILIPCLAIPGIYGMEESASSNSLMRNESVGSIITHPGSPLADALQEPLASVENDSFLSIGREWSDSSPSEIESSSGTFGSPHQSARSDSYSSYSSVSSGDSRDTVFYEGQPLRPPTAEFDLDSVDPNDPNTPDDVAIAKLKYDNPTIAARMDTAKMRGRLGPRQPVGTAVAEFFEHEAGQSVPTFKKANTANLVVQGLNRHARGLITLEEIQAVVRAINFPQEQPIQTRETSRPVQIAQLTQSEQRAILDAQLKKQNAIYAKQSASKYESLKTVGQEVIGQRFNDEEFGKYCKRNNPSVVNLLQYIAKNEEFVEPIADTLAYSSTMLAANLQELRAAAAALPQDIFEPTAAPSESTVSPEEESADKAATAQEEMSDQQPEAQQQSNQAETHQEETTNVEEIKEINSSKSVPTSEIPVIGAAKTVSESQQPAIVASAPQQPEVKSEIKNANGVAEIESSAAEANHESAVDTLPPALTNADRFSVYKLQSNKLPSTRFRTLLWGIKNFFWPSMLITIEKKENMPAEALENNLIHVIRQHLNREDEINQLRKICLVRSAAIAGIGWWACAYLRASKLQAAAAIALSAIVASFTMVKDAQWWQHSKSILRDHTYNMHDSGLITAERSKILENKFTNNPKQQARVHELLESWRAQ